MAVKKGILPEILSFILILSLTVSVSVAYFVEKVGPEDCKTGADDEYHEYFDISQLLCQRCSQPAIQQTVTADGELWNYLQCSSSRGK